MASETEDIDGQLRDAVLTGSFKQVQKVVEANLTEWEAMEDSVRADYYARAVGYSVAAKELNLASRLLKEIVGLATHAHQAASSVYQEIETWLPAAETGR